MSTTNAKHTPGELALEYINRADAPYDPAGPAIADLHGLQSALARVTAQRDQCAEALALAAPMLEGRPVHNPNAMPSGRLGGWPVHGAGSEPSIPSPTWVAEKCRAVLRALESEGGAS